MLTMRTDASDREHVSGGGEFEVTQEARELPLFPPQADVETNPMAPGHHRAWLVGVQLPRVKIKEDRLPLVSIHPPDPGSGQRQWQEPEVAPSPDGEIDSKKACGPDGKLDQVPGSLSQGFVGEPRGGAVTVAIVEDRVDARVVAEPFLQEDVVRPCLVAADREIGRTVADHRLTGNVLEDGFGVAQVGSEFSGRLARDELVTVTVAGDFVALPCNLSNESWVSCRHLTQDEERCFDFAGVQEGKDALGAHLDAAFETAPRRAVRAFPKDRGVEILFKVHGERIHDRLLRLQCYGSHTSRLQRDDLALGRGDPPRGISRINDQWGDLDRSPI